MLMDRIAASTPALLLSLLLGASGLSGCAAGVAAAGGYVVGEEAAEDDGDFDPAEEAFDDDSDDYKDND